MKAVFTGMDTYPARSLRLMLESVGYEVTMLSDAALDRLSKVGYKGGVRAEMLKNMGYRPAEIPFVDESALASCDLFVDIKRKEADTILPVYPRLKGKMVMYVINGGWDDYEDYAYYYPTITNNMWIMGAFRTWSPIAWDIKPKEVAGTKSPMGLLHNAKNWGFGGILDRVIDRTGLRVYGSYDSPAGMLLNDKVPEELRDASCFVHLKASDCPGWALFEAFATATPVVVTDLFIQRMNFRDLYEDGVTCLTWGKTSYEKKDEKHLVEFMDRTGPQMIEDIVECVERLKDPETNRRIGMAGHERWKQLTEWTPVKRDALAKYLGNHVL